MARKKQQPSDPVLYDKIKEEIKNRVAVWPSAYASGMLVKSYKDAFYRIHGENSNPYEGSFTDTVDIGTGLGRWFAEEWVNVCEKDSNGNYKKCGRQFGNLESSRYPYCRPLYRIDPKRTPKTVPEFSKEELDALCRHKRSLKQGVMGKPTRIFHDTVFTAGKQSGGADIANNDIIILRDLTSEERQQVSKQFKKYAVEIPGGKTVYFGHNQYEDYTIHKDKSRLQNYLSRHQARENWNFDGIESAGFWSRWLLWNKPSFSDSIRDIEKRFNVRIENSTNR